MTTNHTDYTLDDNPSHFEDVKAIAGAHVAFAIVSNIPMLLFLKAAKPLMGWESDFAFVLLCVMAICGIIANTLYGVACALMLLSESIIPYWITGTITTIYPEDELEVHYRTTKFVGNIYYVLKFAVPILHILLGIHRFILTVFPFKSRVFITTTITKTIFISVLLTIILCMACLEFVLGDEAFVFCRSSMQMTSLTQSYDYYFLIFNAVINNTMVIGNALLYGSLLLVLAFRGQLNLRNNAELKMTLQCLISVSIEVFFYLYANHGELEMISQLIQATDNLSNMLYPPLLFMPYLLMNRNIRQNIWKRKESFTLFRRTTITK